MKLLKAEIAIRQRKIAAENKKRELEAEQLKIEAKQLKVKEELELEEMRQTAELEMEMKKWDPEMHENSHKRSRSSRLSIVEPAKQHFPQITQEPKSFQRERDEQNKTVSPKQSDMKSEISTVKPVLNP